MAPALEVFVHRIYFFLEAFIIAYVFAINAIYFLLLALSFAVIRRRGQDFTGPECASLAGSAALPRVSIIMPAHNEALSIAESVRSMMKLRYPSFEIIVVNDGSRDRTLDVLVESYSLFRSARTSTGTLNTKPVRGVYESATPLNLVVVDKENGGKADALNTGINYAGSPLILVVDADSLLDPDALLQVIKPYLEDPQRVVAVGGMVRAVNDCPVRHGRVRANTTSQFYIANCQSVEYLRAFLGGRIGFGFLNALLIISGAFGLFRRDVVLEVGGFRHDTVGEDMELVVRLHKLMRRWKRDYHIAFVPTPVCWTEVPVSLRVLRRQRRRWQRGTVESILLHREMILNPRYGLVGLFAVPYFLLFEMLGPLVEFVGYALTVVGLVFGIIAPVVAVLFFAVSTAFGVFLSSSSLALDQYTQSHHIHPKDVVKLFLAAVFENLGFRQWITFCRVQGLIEGLRGKQGGWGEMERQGFSTAAAAGR